MAIPLLGRIKRSWLLAGGAVIVLVAAFLLWRHIWPRESTDDAQVAGHVSPIATRVGGTVTAIHVKDNQQVHAGDVLIEIDRRDYELAVSQAEADLAAAEAAARAARANVPVTSASAQSEMHVTEAGTGNAEAAQRAAEREVDASQAKLTAARAHLAEVTANATRASQDLARLKTLVAKDEVPRQQYDMAEATAKATDATVASAQAAIHEAEANLAVAESRRDQAAGTLAQAQAQAKAAATAPQQIALIEARAAAADAQVMQARAALDVAKLNLERTTVRAPSNGLVSRRSVEVGQVVQAGQPVMALTALDDVWVVANFKETQLDEMRTGQPAAVSVDAYDGRTYRGHVDSIAGATGATFSLLPPDNASGNFVKVVQRVPVKILLDEKQDQAAPLRPGMSVTATVYLK
ncbi:MAG TPA: HlyD family secretion protein [Vicinamibacterales bacterium]|jgi:membrane fusion protein (multidrug efflux system)|nr:HlyD family secretion protein [Vicinamibacterales bacterium]